MEAGRSGAGVKPLGKWMKWNLRIGSILPFLAGLSLFVGTTQTDETSAWTIDSAITAATIGGAYWGGFFLTFLAGLERTWAAARVAIPPVFVFTVLNAISTAIEFDRFHTSGDEAGAGTVFLTYLWLIPYAIGPLLLIGLWIYQERIPGGDPPREAPLSGAVRAVLALQGLVFAAAGIALFIAPLDVAGEIWPWELTPLTGRVIAAWLISFAVGVAWVLRENDYARSRPAAVSYLLFGLLEIVALLRYTDDVDFGSAKTWIYLGFMASVMLVGAYTTLASSRARPQATAPAPA